MSTVDIVKVDLNQWEVTYVNHIPRGVLWNKLLVWPRLLPGLLTQVDGTNILTPEYGEAVWHFEISPRKGRLHSSVRRALVNGQETLDWTQTARGPMSGVPHWDDIAKGLSLGHDAIIEAFERFASAEALSFWKGKTACQTH